MGKSTTTTKDAGSVREVDYQIGQFRLDIARGALFHGDTEVAIRPKAYAVLQYLVAHPGLLISKQDLLDAVWADTIVTEDSVTQCIREIRKALGDKQQAILVTVPRRGYRFNPPQVDKPQGSGTVPSRRWVFGLTALFPLLLIALWWALQIAETPSPSPRVAVVHSIAVLPFLDLTEQRDQAFIATGIADDLRDHLGAVKGLRVAARSSSQIIVAAGMDAPAMSTRLGVDALVEGSLRQRGRRHHLSVQLIEGHSGLSLWSKTYTVEPNQLLAVQQQVFRALLSQLRPEKEPQISGITTVDTSAHELMLLARYREQLVYERPDVDRSVLLEAIALYRKAAAADPQSALIQSRLARVLLYSGDLSGAEAPVHRALILNPELSEVQETLGRYYWSRGLPGAGAAWRRAIDLNPNNADALASYAYWYWQQGFSDGPEELFRKALELDPLSLNRYADLGSFLGHEARVAKTRVIMGQVASNFSGPASYRLRARLHELLGELDHSIALTITARAMEPLNPSHQWALAELYAEIGDEATALELEPTPDIGLLYKLRRYPELIEMAESRMFDQPSDVLLHYLLAYAYLTQDRFSEAIGLLESLGLPGIVLEESKQAIDLEALVTYINAMDGQGEKSEVTRLADWYLARPHVENSNWWVNFNKACIMAIVGQHTAALEKIHNLQFSPRLPWDSLLLDAPCFRQYQQETVYQAALEFVTLRRRALRQQLPITLAEYGVEL